MGEGDEDKFKMNFWGLYLLGMTIKLGGCVAGWNVGLSVGPYGFMIAALIIMLGYSMLAFCIAELVSVVAFPGGFYGYARCTLGPFWGYFIGCSGLIESTFYLAASILLLGRAVCAAFDFSSVHEPAWWCICFLYVMGFHAQGGSIIRKFMAVCCIISMSIILIYLLGSIPHLNFTKYALITHKSGFTGTTKDFFIILRLPAWFFIGIDLLSLTSREVKKPSKVIPKAMLCVLGTMIVICAWVIVSVVSQAPGATADVLARKSLFPLSFGFVNIFNISYSDGAIFSIVPLFASCVGYMFIVGRQMHSMAMSGLLPDVCRITYGEDFTPIVNMVITTLVCMVALVFAWLFNPYLLLFRMAVIGGCVVYIAMFACYILFSIRYSSMERSYRNPFGVYGAAAGIVIFTIVLISVLALQPVFEATVSYVVLMLLAIVYYFQVVRDRQFFSEDEQRLFLRAYVVNANMKKKKSIYCRVSSSISATRFFSCFDVDSMYHNFLPRPLPADRKVTPLSLPIRTAEMSAAVTAAEAGQVSLPKADIDDAVTSDEHTISIYRTSVHNMTSPRMNSLNMLPSKPLSKQNSSSAMIDLPSGIDVDAAADLILEHHIELMRRRKPDELSYNVSSIRQVLTGVKASRRRSSHQEPSQQQRQIYTHASDSPAGSDYQPSPVQSDQLLPSADGSMKTADDDPESMGALMFSSISPPASRPRDESFDIQTLVVSEEHKK